MGHLAAVTGASLDDTVFGGSLVRGDNVEQYARIVSHRVARVEVEPARIDRFRCRSADARLGQLRFTRIQSDPVQLRRSVRCIESDSQTQYLVGLNLSGRMLIEHGHRRTVIDAGHLCLLDKAAPYHTTFAEPADRVLVSIPRRLLESRLADPGRYLSVTPATGSGIGRLAHDHLQFLLSEGHLLSNSNRTHAIEMCIDLIALAFKSSEEQGEDLERNNAGGGPMLLSRVKAHLQCNLDDPELSPSMAAAALGLSKRYLHKLFSNSGTTFGAWVREERLLRARSLLVDSRYGHLTITEVAMRQGFNDIPHFSRQFRARFGHTPRDARAGAPPTA